MTTKIPAFEQLAFQMRGFPLPEVQPIDPVVRKGRVVDQYLAFTIREDGEWAEAIGDTPEWASRNLAVLLAQKPGRNDR